jgi:hypothetical protein
MPLPGPAADHPPEGDEQWRLGSDHAAAVMMGRCVVGIVVVLVAAMLGYGFTRYTTVANVARASYPSTTGSVPASHKISPARSP